MLTGEGRRRRVSGATKPPTPWLAAVEAAEQAQELRVGGCGGSSALTGVGCGRVVGDGGGGLEGMAGGGGPAEVAA
jgi:hypothetical protein